MVLLKDAATKEKVNRFDESERSHNNDVIYLELKVMHAKDLRYILTHDKVKASLHPELHNADYTESINTILKNLTEIIPDD